MALGGLSVTAVSRPGRREFSSLSITIGIIPAESTKMASPGYGACARVAEPRFSSLRSRRIIPAEAGLHENGFARVERLRAGGRTEVLVPPQP